MPYFLYPETLVENKETIMKGEEFRHISQSRRIQTGEVIEVQGKNNQRFQAEILKIQKKQITILPFKEIEVPPESPLQVHLFQALIKERNVDWILQKTTELGVSHIEFFYSQNSRRFHSNEKKNKQIRWQKIAWEACKQSGRVSPPTISFSGSLERAAQKANRIVSSKEIYRLVINPVPQVDSLKDISQNIAIFVGPEGGFIESEVDLISSKTIGLGPRILRSETAAIAAITILQHKYGDLR